MNIAKVIGTPALLEQCAEECEELAHVCLKMARKLRGENPTPVSKAELWEHINEEAADVETCIEQLYNAGILSRTEMNSFKKAKTERWINRINRSKDKEEEN